MPKISIVKCSDYNPGDVRESIKEIFDSHKDFGKKINHGERVLLNPNLLLAKTPDKAVTTHPEVLKAIAEEIINRGGKVLIGDSPGGRYSKDSLEKLYKITGIYNVCRETGAEAVFFDNNEVIEKKNENGKAFRTFSLTGIIDEVDVIISVPKLKTHGLTILTASVKNNFGFIPGYRKPLFHIKASERGQFAEMLIDLALTVKPDFTIVDGIWAMEGDGPSSGSPKNLGLVFGGSNQFALDWVISKICNIDPLIIPTNKIAYQRGLIPDSNELKISGKSIEEVKDESFVFPKGSLFDKIPAFISGFAKNKLIPKPVVNVDKCTGCKICFDNCYSKAIIMESGYPVFNYKKCIRCYCCHELCPESAIFLSISKFVQRVIYRKMNLKL